MISPEVIEFPIRAAFFGSDAIALPALNWIRSSEGRAIVDLAAVVTQPDRPHGRGMKCLPNAVTLWARDNGIPVRQPTSPGPEDAEWLRENRIAFVLVMAYGHILRDALLQAPRFPMLNLHASLLPRYRGASPIAAAVAAGDAHTGLSLMQVVRRMDAGPVYDQESVTIESEDTTDRVAAKIAAASIPLLRRALPLFFQGAITPIPQNAAEVTYTRLIHKEDGALCFQQDVEELVRRVNALHPWPGSYFCYRGDRIRIGSCTASYDSSEVRETIAPGTVLAAHANGLSVQTAKGHVLIRELQRPGGRLLPAPDFLRGYPIPPGTVLESGENRPLYQGKPFRRSS